MHVRHPCGPEALVIELSLIVACYLSFLILFLVHSSHLVSLTSVLDRTGLVVT